MMPTTGPADFGAAGCVGGICFIWSMPLCIIDKLYFHGDYTALKYILQGKHKDVLKVDLLRCVIWQGVQQ